MSQQWITNRRPEHGDGWDGYVWKFEFDKLRRIVRWNDVQHGEPWMPITPPEPYVKSNRWDVKEYYETGNWYVVDRASGSVRSYAVPTREAAERIAAIYEEVMP